MIPTQRTKFSIKMQCIKRRYRLLGDLTEQDIVQIRNSDLEFMIIEPEFQEVDVLYFGLQSAKHRVLMRPGSVDIITRNEEEDTWVQLCWGNRIALREVTALDYTYSISNDIT